MYSIYIFNYILYLVLFCLWWDRLAVEYDFACIIGDPESLYFANLLPLLLDTEVFRFTCQKIKF